MKHIRKFVQRIWKKEGLQLKEDLRVSLATFGRDVVMRAEALRYSKGSVKTLMQVLMDLSKQQHHDQLVRSTALYDCLLSLIQSVLRKKRRYKNIRILLLSDGENWSLAPQRQEIIDYLKCNKVITLDCIQTTRSERGNAGLRKLCTVHSHQGRYWNPLTSGDWEAILKSMDFVYPHKRNLSYDLTVDSESDSDSDSDRDS